jgi:carbon-monoxide dehydrogenase large subunit
MTAPSRRAARLEDGRFLTGRGEYTANLAVCDALHAVFVRSPFAHARILRIDPTTAVAMPGVVEVVVAADLELPPLAPLPVPGIDTTGLARPWLARETTRYVGEPVAVVVAGTQPQAFDAAEAVQVDYDALPVVDDIAAARRGDHLLFPTRGSNVILDVLQPADGDWSDGFFAGCDIVVRLDIRHPRIAPCPLEPRSAVAWWDDGRLVHCASTQSPHMVRSLLAAAYGLDAGAVRVISPDVGGSFGAKQALYPDEHLLGVLSRRCGRPVRWTETRSESMIALGHGRAQHHVAELGGTTSGDLLAYRLTVVQDAGAYPFIGAMMPMRTALMSPGVYDIPRVATRGLTVLTNATPVTAYRGAGRPEAATTIERTVDVFCTEAGLDPAVVRRRNVVRSFPHDNRMGASYDSGNYVTLLDRALDTVGYETLRAHPRTHDRDAVHLGVGMAAYVEVSNSQGGEWVCIEVTPTGTVEARVGTFSYGQGHATTYAELLADRFGLAVEVIHVVQGDTDLVPAGKGSSGSRSMQSGGVALAAAAEQICQRACDVAADMLEASSADVVLDTARGRFHVVGTPEPSLGWGDVAAGTPAGLRAELDTVSAPPTYPSGVHVAVVSVDGETGAVHLERIVAVDDCGTILNPVLAAGQRHGGLAQGIGQALFENVIHDDSGVPLNASFAGYGFASAAELPSFELLEVQTPSPHNPLGVKGVGESGATGSTAAVQNAVVDALAHLGVRHVDAPCSPEAVWREIQRATQIEVHQ